MVDAADNQESTDVSTITPDAGKTTSKDSEACCNYARVAGQLHQNLEQCDVSDDQVDSNDMDEIIIDNAAVHVHARATDTASHVELPTAIPGSQMAAYVG
eukprot:879390_1